MVENQELGGYNLIKIAKYINIIIGIALLVIVVLEFITFKFINPFAFMITVFEAIFGLVIIASSFNMVCIRRNFLFMMTGIGKGFFNIFVGSMLFFNGDGTISASFFMGWAMIIGGCIFIFLSRFRQLSDEDINRAVSIQKKSVFNAVGTVAHNNQGAIKKAAYDNQDVIGQVAYDNKDIIA